MAQQLEAIWLEHRGELKAFIQKRVRSSSEVEDILHDVFLKIFTKIRSVRQTEHMRAWLFTVTRNAVADSFRGKHLMVELPEDLADKSQASDSHVLEDVGSSLRLMIGALPEKIRAALVMADLEGAKQREVALRLGISLPAVKSRILRGRVLIRRMIEDCCRLELDSRGHIMDYTVKAKNRSDCCR